MSRLRKQCAPEGQEVGSRQRWQFTDLAYDVLAHSAPVSHGHSRSDQPASQAKVSGAESQKTNMEGWAGGQLSGVRSRTESRSSCNMDSSKEDMDDDWTEAVYDLQVLQ